MTSGVYRYTESQSLRQLDKERDGFFIYSVLDLEVHNFLLHSM